MKRRIPLEEIKRRLPAFVKLDESTYKTTHQKARFIDSEYGEFWAVPSDVWNGHGHRKRGIKKLQCTKITPVEEVIKRLPENVEIKKDTYFSLQTPAVFIDKEYGEFIAKPRDVLKYRKHRQRATAEKVNIKLTVEEFKARLPKEISLVEGTYVNTHTKCKFIDSVYGAFENTPHAVLSGSFSRARGSESRRKTCLERYGVEYVAQHRDFLLKMKQSARKTYKLFHWKNKQELVCCGSYEKQVVEHLNQNEIDFEWQIKFNLNCGVYFCDLYLKDRDVYVEIKGWWRQQISKDKWEEFHKRYPNSELWNRDKLKELGLKVH